ncbi:MAG: bifunctional phosphopantothenoylcysteine decarboxylase/phosphopantothenate--cysteine ligase CoaBC [Rhodospirillales bacterium]|nr:bifunctional phosphopantothenoylcysteine decarboxylase/phosphopantothenate--cysteine ligase CoaBC [Alphaproteobacteria bacterium]MBL6948368.1 bifunctional phosphopantothenoylcysteine decarboxylase/phosphopantothenate--cysteine ligase CoaBC [Rhodospirillales bacterium]
MLQGKKILLIVSGGIAAYKCPDLVRSLRKRGADVRCILTRGGAEFVTPLALGAVSEDKVYEDLFSLTDEAEMGHIRLSREADVVLVAPATANLLAKMASGIADDLASTALLATDKPVLCAPAMNVQMWENPATRSNIEVLSKRGIGFIGPEEGDMACGEWGLGRMSEPEQITAALEGFFRRGLPLDGTRALVTSGPTHEAIDPVRYLANRSSGKQGHAIAAALARLGSATTLVSGPTGQPDPAGVDVVHVESAVQMLDACTNALPVDVAVLAAAVSDWRPEHAEDGKIKKAPGATPPGLALVENPDILATLSAPGNLRPRLVIGFAAETDDILENAKAKRTRKGCDWIVANDVSPETGTFAGDANTVHLITQNGIEDWPRQSKTDVARRLADRVAETLAVTA